jgi:hypothetical protein
VLPATDVRLEVNLSSGRQDSASTSLLEPSRSGSWALGNGSPHASVVEEPQNGNGLPAALSQRGTGRPPDGLTRGCVRGIPPMQEPGPSSHYPAGGRSLA